ncbi:class II histone deacetylase [Govanella unica]|uniref:Class II histone deacetylase n=1 Tax=Govanella unica TaxID=2975056 RepID=A0A9X3TYS9_9PROT|nr:class II histone deacetylase [Govania unica]MDA5194435.1 class II histone deacetylase [Govania unica]
MTIEPSRTGLVWHESYMWHDTGNYAGVMPPGPFLQPGRHVENPEAKRRLKNLLDISELTPALVPIAPRAATVDQLTRIHPLSYIEKVIALSAAGGGDSGAFAPVGKGSFEIAALSAGGIMAAIAAVVAGEVRNAYALVRPPGHHAEVDQGMGFCIFANGSLAAKYAQAELGLKRVAIVDWDVHHGNGAQHIFWTDPSVLTISIHQDQSFPPDSGHVHEIGEGAGAYFNLNIPLPAGSGTEAYLEAFDRVIIPALEAYQPDLILVPCGFDAGGMDPLARMALHSDSFREMTRRVKAAAERLCDGRLVLLHEGGYSAETVPFFGLAVIEELADRRTAVEDPFLPIIAGDPAQKLLPHQAAVIDAAAENVARMKAVIG